MDEILKNFGGITGVFISIGAILFSAGFAYEKIFNGKKNAKAEEVTSADGLVKFWKERADEYKTAMETKDRENTEKFSQMSREIGELRGQLNSETQQKKDYLAILQNRDPETKKFMEYMMKATQDHDIAHTEMMRVLGEIHNFVKEEHDRDFKIDATIHKQ